VPAAPVHDVQAALENPFVMDEGRVRTADHPGGPIRLLAPPIRCPGDEPPCRAAPALGADTDRILANLGFTHAEIARLRGAGVV
jgi:crotonobetainyl-CoA:carnitine CoA-transferase CaiB-like acyl-CoA transferase